MIEQDASFSFTFPAEQLNPYVVTLGVILKAHLSRSREDRQHIPHSQEMHVSRPDPPRLLVPWASCCFVLLFLITAIP